MGQGGHPGIADWRPSLESECFVLSPPPRHKLPTHSWVGQAQARASLATRTCPSSAACRASICIARRQANCQLEELNRARTVVLALSPHAVARLELAGGWQRAAIPLTGMGPAASGQRRRKLSAACSALTLGLTSALRPGRWPSPGPVDVCNRGHPCAWPRPMCSQGAFVHVLMPSGHGLQLSKAMCIRSIWPDAPCPNRE